MSLLRHCFRYALFSVLLFAMTAPALATATFIARTGQELLDGDAPHLLVTGLRPGETATIHAFRKTNAYQPPSYTATPVLAHAQAAFRADRTGTINVDTAIPTQGTYSGADPLGLLWSGTRSDVAGDPAQPVTRDLPLKDDADIIFRLEAPSLRGVSWLETRIHLTDGADALSIQDVAIAGLNGAFARPKISSSTPLPAILLLHGSEGGSAASARYTAIRFAHLGYAAFAVNYFAWPNAGIANVPHALIDIPVETLASARAWLLQQPGVDARKVAVWGVSKGAELALVGAAHYDWIDRVVACVPSSVVWSGFGRPPAPGEVYSSWSLAGTGLPYIPYDRYEDVLSNKLSASFVHTRSLEKATPEQQAAARIPIETTSAKLLLLAAAKDHVWPSSRMTHDIETTFRNAGRQNQLTAIIFPDASHYICGTGSDPQRINPVHNPEGNDPSPEAVAHAAETSWQQTKAFLQQRK